MRRLAALLLCLLLLLPCGAEEAGEAYLFRPAAELPPERLAGRAELLSAGASLWRTEEEALIRELEAEGLLLCWDVDGPVSLLDPDLDEAGEEEALEWSLGCLGVDYARQRDLLGEGVRIGIIDSGLRPDFAELTGAAVAEGLNFLVSEDSAARHDTRDAVGHGTFVASLLADGDCGIVPGAELVPLRCFDARTGGISGIVSAIYAAVDTYHCQVVNMSFGTKSDNALLREAVEYALAQGVILVAACGNLTGTTTGSDPLYYPAAYDGVVSVGAVDRAREITAVSSRNASVDVTAPGAELRGRARTGDGYTVAGGTSYSTPFAAGAAALALSVDPALTPEDFLALLEATSEDLGAPGRDYAYGWGFLNAGLILARLLEDGDSLLLSDGPEGLCLSANLPDTPDVGCCLAAYSSGGRLLDLICVTDPGGCLSNQALPPDTARAVLFSLDTGDWRPVSETRRIAAPQ